MGFAISARRQTHFGLMVVMAALGALFAGVIHGGPVAPMYADPVYPEMHLATLAKTADLIVVGRASSATTRRGGRFSVVATDTTIEVKRTLKGDESQALVVTTAGGRFGNLSESVEDSISFEKDQDMLLFLSPGPDGELVVTGGPQGKWVMVGDHATNGVDEASLSEIAAAARR